MRRILHTMIFLVLLGTVFVSAQEQNVFRDLKWGDSPEVLGINAQLINSDSDFDYWVKENEDLELGPLRVKYIFYGFRQNQLSIIMISITSQQINLANAIAEAKYGQPIIKKDAMTVYWKAEEKTMCFVGFDVNGTTVFFLANTDIIPEIQRYLPDKGILKYAY